MFNSIVLDQWDRKPYFDHYLNQVRCTYSITANLDITLLINELKLKGLKFYPALIHMISTVVNAHREFRTCFDAEEDWATGTKCLRVIRFFMRTTKVSQRSGQHSMKISRRSTIDIWKI